MSTYHTTVLLKETIDNLQVKKGRLYVDATLGGGGHSFEILNRGGRVLGLDADQEALDFVKKELRIRNQELRIEERSLILAKGNFKDIDNIAREENIQSVAGAVFDLGVSSHQLESAERGFTFMQDGPLDMRMDRDLSVKAEGLVNILHKSELAELFEKYGEEPFARRIADAIISARKVKAIQTTAELVEIVKRVVPRRNSDINPATKVFQALRIAINDELGSLKDALPKYLELLEPGGRLCIISFHSLEDRIIKQQFNQWAAEGEGIVITKKPIIPTDEELERNRRARSSKLRVFEKK
jgi:16S rRNA (cytosine1402-N4)-methyltransferase